MPGGCGRNGGHGGDRLRSRGAQCLGRLRAGGRGRLRAATLRGTAAWGVLPGAVMGTGMDGSDPPEQTISL